MIRKKKSILFVRPDFHCSFFLRDEFRKNGWKADIYVQSDYPNHLLYCQEDILRAPLHIENSTQSKFLMLINEVTLAMWWHFRFLRYEYHLYYGRPPIFFNFLERIGFLNRLFKKGFLWELWIAKKLGIKLLYIPTGCHDNDLKITWSEFDGGSVCGNCGFSERCDDNANALNFSRVNRFFSFAIGNDAEAKKSKEIVEKIIKYKSIDLNLWAPDIDIPEEHRLDTTSNIRILHGSQLSKSGRLQGGKNIKGSPFVLEAIEKLQAEGFPVEYLYIDDKASSHMRYYQAQADIVVEQLIYGWWGSTAVEAAALGKPVVCYLRPSWKNAFFKNFPEYESLPIVEANTRTIYDVLKSLVVDSRLRKMRGAESRRFAERHFDPRRNAHSLIRLLESI